ncbi:MAG: ATP-binding protein [Cyanobacteria bacterium P01_C01_bin.118]
MTTADDIFEQSRNNIERLGLKEIPFTESPVDLESEMLTKIFTGRENELRQVFNLFQSRERRRILIYGRIGIGKSAFLLEVLSVLKRKLKKSLTTYISLPPDLDLATTALIALAQAMPEDDWAQQQLYKMGIPTNKALKERSSEIGGNALVTAKTGEKDLPIIAPEYPSISLDTLLDRAKKKYPNGIIIAIDDLDKQNPSRIRQLMYDAQGMLKGPAWFLLTGHPVSMTGDLLTTERGLFDLRLPLEELDFNTTYKMLINYLSSVRIDNDCTDPEDPRCVLPFLPETAAQFCEASRGKPRLFNRLGNIVLSRAADLEAKIITPDVLKQGLQAALPTLREKAALNFKENRVQAFLQQRGSISDETITLDDMEKLGVRDFAELLPILERLEAADLVHQPSQDETKTFEPLVLPISDIED